MAEGKLKTPKGGISYECVENDNTIIVFKHENNIDMLYFGNRSIPSEGWTVIGYKDLIEALKKADTNGGT